MGDNPLQTSNDELFNFPCQFPIKCIGKKENLKNIVCAIVKNHVGEIHHRQVKIRPSKKSNYLSVTITILASSKSQIDSIYTELNNHPAVLYSL